MNMDKKEECMERFQFIHYITDDWSILLQTEAGIYSTLH